ncbi:trimeric intracellular cation channel family protein [Marinicauda salina]|uniref:Trimeric intracellular cation channel family protein n=1 Tax=Marinicauda salina TaxID=2135793 RepID=A0A2U2BVC2_9PROT|nr:TRIC cation channel family protein [Marinicauda salina]PWE17976.1 trimeric intracellular cation channel family protein [Marinicauda salina]
MSVELVFSVLDFVGVFFFALSGGILAARKTLDPFGAAIVGAAAGMGGGTLRDLFLGALPVFWVDAPAYLGVAVVAALVGYYGSTIVRGERGARQRALAWADAAGLSVFTVIGAEAGLAAGAHWSIAMLTGVMSAAFGGLIRDVIVNDVPLVLRAEIYALASLAGAGVYVAAIALGLSGEIAAPATAALVFALRGAAMIFNWTLPPVSKLD